MVYTLRNPINFILCLDSKKEEGKIQLNEIQLKAGSGSFFFFLIYFFGAALGLCCCVRASHCGGFSCCGAWALGTQASVVVAHGLSCSAACGILPDQGSNPCPLHWEADS